MREYVKRLIDCGFSREIALAICHSFARHKDWHGLEKYIYSVEKENEYDLEKEEKEL